MKVRFCRVINLVLWSLLQLVWPLATLAQNTAPDLSSVSLEDLTQMQISVSSFARKDEDLWKTPGAVFVISKEDIAGSSASSIPELLRIVPGMQVAQINPYNWAISARGFNSTFSSKLLVLIDGRTVYSEIYSTARWDQIDLPLEDIERIEVIRGPGAAVWGTNAVNGVVNIITKKARSTRHLEASSEVGRIGESARLRYGGGLGPRGQYRVFASYLHRSPFDDQAGNHAFGEEDIWRGGGRLDWQQTPFDSITIGGDIYGGHAKDLVTSFLILPADVNGQDSGPIAGGYLLGQWRHNSTKIDSAYQIYFNDESRYEFGSNGRTRTLDLDYQSHLRLDAHNDLVWGAGLRFTADHISGAVRSTTLPEYKNYLISGFVQDDLAIIPRRLTVTAGSKFQNGDLAGFQVQPTARILWAPDEKQALWAAASRAAVDTSIQDKYLTLPTTFGIQGGVLVSGELKGNAKIKPQVVLAYEGGYRRRLNRSLTFDLASFFNSNRRFYSIVAGESTFEPTPTPHVFEPLYVDNGFNAHSTGIEASFSWKPLPALSLQASHAWMQERQFQKIPNAAYSVDVWATPHNSFAASASWRFARGWDANSFIAQVGSAPTLISTSDGPVPGTVPSYTRFDMNVAHKIGSFDLELATTNLLTPRHAEFGTATGFIVPSYIPRSASLKAKWSF